MAGSVSVATPLDFPSGSAVAFSPYIHPLNITGSLPYFEQKGILSAEVLAILLAVKTAIRENIFCLHIITDSQLTINKFNFIQSSNWALERIADIATISTDIEIWERICCIARGFTRIKMSHVRYTLENKTNYYIYGCYYSVNPVVLGYLSQATRGVGKLYWVLAEIGKTF